MEELLEENDRLRARLEAAEREQAEREFERAHEEGQRRLREALDRPTAAAWRTEQLRRDFWTARFDALRWNALLPGYGFLRHDNQRRALVYGSAFWSSVALTGYWHWEALRRLGAVQSADQSNPFARPAADARYGAARTQAAQWLAISAVVYAVAILDSALIFQPPFPAGDAAPRDTSEWSPAPSENDGLDEGRTVRLGWTVPF